MKLRTKIMIIVLTHFVDWICSRFLQKNKLRSRHIDNKSAGLQLCAAERQLLCLVLVTPSLMITSGSLDHDEQCAHSVCTAAYRLVSKH